MIQEEEAPAGAPDWMLTYGDMMSLLLTFFIMLVSMSEIRTDRKIQSLLTSMRKTFGPHPLLTSFNPGFGAPFEAPAPARTSERTRPPRAKLARGGVRLQTEVGNFPFARALRSGDQIVMGGVLYFPEGSAALTPETERQLVTIAQQIVGKPQKIEIRGHTTNRPLPAESPYRDHWDLAFARCRATLDYLVGLGLEPRRMRLTSAGNYEPMHTGADPTELAKNSRVEVFLLGETVEDYARPDQAQPPQTPAAATAPRPRMP
jgi:chemotaxis protein MotB